MFRISLRILLSAHGAAVRGPVSVEGSPLALKIIDDRIHQAMKSSS